MRRLETEKDICEFLCEAAHALADMEGEQIAISSTAGTISPGEGFVLAGKGWKTTFERKRKTAAIEPLSIGRAIVPDYTLEALTSAEVRKDRTGVTLHLDTDKGPINITMDPAQLDHFATSMEGIEQQLTILDPVTGRAPGEPVQMRFYIVDGMDVGNAVVNGVASVAVVIKAGNTSRAYAFDREHAETLVRRVGDELPSLGRLKGDERH